MEELETAYIYKAHFYKTTKCIKPHMSLYYADINDIHKLFNTIDYKKNLVKVEYLPVKLNNYRYIEALRNSNIKYEKPIIQYF
jgi:hypothetical protein